MTRCERCGKRTINLFGGLCIECDENEELPGGNPGTYGPDSGTAHRLGPSG